MNLNATVRKSGSPAFSEDSRESGSREVGKSGHCRLLLLLVLTAGLVTAVEPALVNTNAMDIEHAPVCAESEPFRARIVVQNPNDVAVKVDKLDATCTCATLTLENHFLLPHATTELVIEVENLNRSEAQRIGVSIYLTDPDLESIEVVALWTVRAHIQVDSLAAPGADPLTRPKRTFQDVYRFPSKVRPDELQKLRKRVRLSCPEGEVPEGGLQVTGIEYPGKMWMFIPTVQTDGSILIDARGNPEAAGLDERVYDETAMVLTNHAKKPRIPLVFVTYVGKDAGAVAFDPDGKRGGEFRQAAPADAGEPGMPAP